MIVTTGGTGFGPRDLTPEGTAQVLDRVAPGLAEAMRLASPLGRLSRATAGTKATALVLNLPGSTAGSVECLEAVLDVLPHALELLAGESAALSRDEAANADERHMARAVELAHGVPHDDVAQSVGRLCHRRRCRRRRWRRCDGASRRPARGDRRASPPPADELEAAPSTSTLEPCAHQGRTPPCTELARPGRRLQCRRGIADPDPEGGGAGFRALEAGSRGDHGRARRRGERPAATVPGPPRRPAGPSSCSSWPTTLDGRTAAPDGSSRWITGPEARRDVHRLRAESDAVLVGAGTVRSRRPRRSPVRDDTAGRAVERTDSRFASCSAASPPMLAYIRR